MSVGHVARLLEEAGIPTVIIASRVFRDRLEALRVPRLVLTRSLLGRPLGRPNDRASQRRAVRAALELLEGAAAGGAVREIGTS